MLASGWRDAGCVGHVAAGRIPREEAYFRAFCAMPPCRRANSVTVDVFRSLSDQYGRNVLGLPGCLPNEIRSDGAIWHFGFGARWGPRAAVHEVRLGSVVGVSIMQANLVILSIHDCDVN